MKKLLLIVACMFMLVGCGDVKLKNGENAAVTFKDGEAISSDELYEKLKNAYGAETLINMIDTYLLDKEYEVTKDEKSYISEVVSSVKKYAKSSDMEYMDYVSKNYRISTEKGFEDYIALNYRRSLWITDWTKTQVSDKQINEYYETMTIGDIEASHILISTKGTDDMTDDEKATLEKEALKKAKDIITKLNNGEDFAELAKEYSEDEASAKNGGTLGSFNRGKMTSAFEEAAIALKVGEYSKTPVKTEYGYHIIYKTAQKDKPELSTVKDTIIETIAQEMLSSDTTLYSKAILALREKYEMTIKDSVLKSGYDSATGQ